MSWKDYKLKVIDENIEELNKLREEILNTTEEPNTNTKFKLQTSIYNQFMIIQKSKNFDDKYTVWIVITDPSDNYIKDIDRTIKEDNIVNKNYLQDLSDGWFSKVESFKQLLNEDRFENVPSNLVLELLMYLNH